MKSSKVKKKYSPAYFARIARNKQRSLYVLVCCANYYLFRNDHNVSKWVREEDAKQTEEFLCT